jgi:hypothetical protein
MMLTGGWCAGKAGAAALVLLLLLLLLIRAWMCCAL